MLDDKSFLQLDQAFKRIFGLRIGRITFREAQNAILTAVQGDKEQANTLIEILLLGEVSDEMPPGLRSLVNNFSTPLRLARDVYERGDFLQMVTSDLVRQGNHGLFVNRVKRIDGEEFQFVSDTKTTLHVLNHFLSRFQDLEPGDLKEERQGLLTLKSQLDKLVSTLKPEV